jgi:hypothetical protein
MAETGDHCIKQGKPGSEGQSSHVFPHKWKLDLINIYINTNRIIYKYIETEYDYNAAIRRRGKILTPPHLQPEQSISISH